MMNYMLSQVPERGTGRAAKLQGIKTAGKTGTTNAYRDAWFMGFTGNFVGGVWFGNDDFTSSNRMTGGSLPAQTWNRVMTYAHNGIELKPIPYLEDGPSDGERPAPAIAVERAEPTSDRCCSPPRRRNSSPHCRRCSNPCPR